MKKVWIILIAICCTSCLRQQKWVFKQDYSINSSNVNYVDSSKFRYEDSLVILDYNLWDQGGKLLFSIYNKSNSPIYINWKNSNFIYNGYSYQYWVDKVVSQTQTRSTSQSISIGSPTTIYIYSEVNKSNSNGVVSSFASLTNQVSTITKENPNVQIPPRSYNVVNKFSLGIPFVESNDSIVVFTKENSPFNFRNYLAISTNKEFEKEVFIDNDFWVASITKKTTEKGSYVGFDNLDPNPNHFYCTQTMIVEPSKSPETKMGRNVRRVIMGLAVISFVIVLVSNN